MFIIVIIEVLDILFDLLNLIIDIINQLLSLGLLILQRSILLGDTLLQKFNFIEIINEITHITHYIGRSPDQVESVPNL